MAKRNKETAKLKAGITLLSFLSQVASISEDKQKRKDINNTNRFLKAIRYLLGIER
jgi:mannitol/fructose-specific phosphotransferase system IIA component (Ntr-type)